MTHERELILNMLKDGKITVDEATKLLDAIDNNQSEKQSEDYSGEYNKSKKTNKAFGTLTDFVKKTVVSAISGITNNINNVAYNLSDTIKSNKHLITEEIIHDNIKVIEINNNGGDIHLLESDTSYPKVSLFAYYDDNDTNIIEKIKGNFHVECTDGKLFINSENSKTSIKINVFNNAESNKNGYLTDILLEIPKNYHLDELLIKSFNGDIKVANLIFNNSVLNTLNGNIKLFSSNSDNISLKTSNGDISINNSKCKFVKIVTARGNIKVNSVTFKEIDANSSLGDIKLKDISGTPKIIDLKTSLGDIKLDLSKVKTDQNINVKTVSPGSINVSDRFILDNPSKHSATGYTNTKFKISTDIRLKTSMGDLEVK